MRSRILYAISVAIFFAALFSSAAFPLPYVFGSTVQMIPERSLPTASAFMNVTFTNGSSGIMENQTVTQEQGTLLILAAKQIMANNEELRDLLFAAADEAAEDLAPEESSDEVEGSDGGGGDDGGGDQPEPDPSDLIRYHKENITA
jgi:hypothetical protein